MEARAGLVTLLMDILEPRDQPSEMERSCETFEKKPESMMVPFLALIGLRGMRAQSLECHFSRS